MKYLLPHLLSEQAQRTPAAIAVTGAEASLTYGELDDQSDRLAAVLRGHGLGRGDRVGLSLPKSIEAIVGLFGVLKAGGVYVPIDPNAPPARARYIVHNAGARLAIVSTGRVAALAESGDTELDAIIAVPERGAAAAPPGAVACVPWDRVLAASPLTGAVGGVDTDLAYILYTSGSTGTPKGVMIPHRAALTFIRWTAEHFGVCERDVVASHAPLHFDLSIFDVFTTVACGGRVVLVPDRLSTFPTALANFIRDQRLTVWYSVPSALILMLTRGGFTARPYPDLRLVLFAGEVFPLKYLRLLRAHTPARLCNLYGPTETNVCTYYDVTDLPAEREEPVPIGRAIANYDVFAVTDDGRRAAPGEVGELYARGPGLMAGYWGDAEKTRRTLVQNPFAPFPDLVCRTGDLVREEPDGSYAYLGRRDHMVKSRGYRIELGEVEAVLHAHPRIRHAAVVAVPDDEVTNRLRAFVVGDGSNGLTPADVQRHCHERLPKYMVPEQIEFRDALPLTSTGKIDRIALAAAD